MRLCRFSSGRRAATRAGRGRGGRRPLRRRARAARRTGARPRRGRRRAARRARRRCAERLPLADVALLSPATPRKYLAIALNYADHIAESGMEAPEVPMFFNKQVSCVVGPGADDPPPEGLRQARLRGRAGDRDRQALPARSPVESAARGDRRLHDRQRRLGPRLADAGDDDDDRQVLRHPRPARPLAGHRRRARRPAGARHPHLRQRRAAPGRQHRARWSSTASSRSPTSRKPSRSSPAT